MTGQERERFPHPPLRCIRCGEYYYPSEHPHACSNGNGRPVRADGPATEAKPATPSESV
jgi:hypothetical protein